MVLKNLVSLQEMVSNSLTITLADEKKPPSCCVVKTEITCFDDDPDPENYCYRNTGCIKTTWDQIIQSISDAELQTDFILNDKVISDEF